MGSRLLLLLAFLSPLALGQPYPVNVTHSVVPVDLLTVNDVDFVNSTTPKLLFTIDLRLNPPPSSLEVIMEIVLSVRLANGETFPSAAYLKTTPFMLSPSRTFTNLDFRDPAMRQEYSVDEAAKKRFEEIARPTGIMPPGEYAFELRVFRAGGQADKVGDNGFVIDLSNPSTVQLLVPLDADRAVTTFPLFQWLYDGPTSRLCLYEKLPGQASFEEATANTPHLITEVTGTSYQYPSAGVRPLEAGKTYVWFVEGIVRVSGGTQQPIRSPLWSFTVTSGSSQADRTLLDMLEQALDPQYRQLFDQLREQGFAATGTMRLDGEPVSRIDLMRLLNAFRANPAGVLSVRVE